jgi:hypothetical protein
MLDDAERKARKREQNKRRTPESRRASNKMQYEKNREYRRRRMAEPEYAAKIRKQNQEAEVRRRMDLQQVEKRRETSRRSSAKHRETSREAYLASQRKYREKMRMLRPMKIPAHPNRSPVRPAPGSAPRTILHADAIYAAAHRAVPRHLPPHVRDDVISEIFLAVLENRIDVDQIGAEASLFIKEYWRAFGGFNTLSLDAKIGDGETTYLDMLADETEPYCEDDDA